MMNDWKANLTKLVPYEAGEQVEGDDVIKLNSNENPYPPSPSVDRALKNFDYNTLNKYPALGSSKLDAAIAEHHGVGIQNVLSGNSSDEVLAICFRAFFNSKKPVFFPDITYSFYPVWCSYYNIPFKKIPLDDSFRISFRDYTLTENGGVIIPNPNAPTGIEMNLQEIEKLVSENTSSVVLIDEAYADFGEVSAIELTKKYPNLVVTKTMSKSRSLAGLRVGYAIGSQELITALKAAMHSFNAYPLSSVAIDAATASFQDDQYFKETTKRIVSTRENTKTALKKMGFELSDSKTNFLFISHSRIDAYELYKYLFDKRIIVRYFDKDRISDYLRVSIGTEKEMKKFLDAVGEFVEGKDAI